MILFIIWLVSLIMMFVSFHWLWLVAFVVTTVYFLIRTGGNFGSIDFGDFGGGFGD